MSQHQQQQIPDLQQVLVQLQQAGIDQNTIAYIQNLGTSQQQLVDQVTQLTNGLSQVQHALSTQQQTITQYQQQQQQQQPLQKSHIASSVKIEKPSKFDGQPKNFKNWLFTFEQYAQITSLDNNYVQMAQYAVTLFEKAASTWWQVTLQTKPQTLALATLQWHDLKHEMESQFVDSDRTRKLLSSFSSFVQLNDLDSYITNYRKLVLELGKLVTDESVLWQFVKGLKPHLRKEVLKDPNLTTLSDAVLIAERLNAAEKFADNFQDFKAKNKKYKQHVLHDFSDPMEIDTLQQQKRNNPHNNASNTRGNGRTTRGARAGYSGARVNDMKNVQCYYCDRFGHYARDCWVKQREQQARLNNVQGMQPVQPVQPYQVMHTNVPGTLPGPPQSKN